jgi:DNA-binding transcriptional LysR family regulator
MDRLTSLMVFARVAESGGFSAAARRLNMSVTMVSNHIQALEDRLGARLLNRTTRRVSLTEIGSMYYERCARILADLDEADRLAAAQHATPRGTLRLYASMNIVRLLTPIIADFIAAYPAVAIDLTVGERMVDPIEDGYDLVIRPIPPPDSGLVIRRLAPWHHVLCCAPSYLQQHPEPRELSDLAHHNCLRFAFYPSGQDWRFEGANGTPVSVRVQGNVLTSSAEMLRGLAIGGHGIFLAPTFLIADDLAAGRLVRVLPVHRGVEFAINAIYPHRLHLSTKVRRFADLLAERFAQHRKWMHPDVTASEIAHVATEHETVADEGT